MNPRKIISLILAFVCMATLLPGCGAAPAAEVIDPSQSNLKAIIQPVKAEKDTSKDSDYANMTLEDLCQLSTKEMGIVLNDVSLMRKFTLEQRLELRRQYYRKFFEPSYEVGTNPTHENHRDYMALSINDFYHLPLEELYLLNSLQNMPFSDHVASEIDEAYYSKSEELKENGGATLTWLNEDFEKLGIWWYIDQDEQELKVLDCITGEWFYDVRYLLKRRIDLGILDAEKIGKYHVEYDSTKYQYCFYDDRYSSSNNDYYDNPFQMYNARFDTSFLPDNIQEEIQPMTKYINMVLANRYADDLVFGFVNKNNSIRYLDCLTGECFPDYTAVYERRCELFGQDCEAHLNDGLNRTGYSPDRERQEFSYLETAGKFHKGYAKAKTFAGPTVPDFSQTDPFIFDDLAESDKNYFSTPIDFYKARGENAKTLIPEDKLDTYQPEKNLWDSRIRDQVAEYEQEGIWLFFHPDVNDFRYLDCVTGETFNNVVILQYRRDLLGITNPEEVGKFHSKFDESKNHYVYYDDSGLTAADIAYDDPFDLYKTRIFSMKEILPSDLYEQVKPVFVTCLVGQHIIVTDR